MDTLNLQKGRLLIAELALTGDVSFSRAVVFLAEHNQEGSVGFILNKPTEHHLSELLPDLLVDFKLYNGGPVDQDNLYYLHKLPELIPESVEIANGIYWGGNFDQLKEALLANKIKANQIRFFLGYSGWSAHQLEAEILSKSWIITDNEADVLTDVHPVSWREKIEDMGGDYLIWANSPENPAYN